MFAGLSRRLRLWPVFAASAAFFVSCLTTSSPAASAGAGARNATGRTPFARSIREVPATATNADGSANHAYISRSTLTSDESAADMPFEIVLAMRNFSELEARLAHSEIISNAEMQARYYPLAEDRDRVARWVESEGLTLTRQDDNHLAVFARGRVTEVARVFQTSFARVTSEGREYTSAIAAPSVPAQLSPAILGIHGLQPQQKWKRRPHTAMKPLAATAGSLPYYPSQIATAYNAAGLNLTGQGQTIAVYAFAYPSTSDLTTFWNTTATPAVSANIQQVNVAGGPATTPTSDYVEEATLDVEWASALAPAANVRIYAANENDPVADDELIQQVLADLSSNPGLHQLTISFGLDENGADRDYIAIEAQYMAALVSAGVTVFASSGDNGALDNESQTVQIGFPASMPDVTAVGGTNLVLDASNNISTETAWGRTTNAGTTGASGGGISAIFTRPSWQTGAGVPAGTMRLIPDVAAAGDPNTGAFVYYKGGNYTIGGTSWSSPIWAAFCAQINQARAAAGKPPLGALNPRLYPLAGTAALHDITSGGNSVYKAGAGFDLCTGLGTPNVTALLNSTMSDTFAPVIEVSSGDRFTTVGQAATFYTIATSHPDPSFHWQRLAAGSTTWTDLADGTTYAGTSTYALSVNGATLAMSGDQFRCLVQNSISNITSPAMTLTVSTTGVSTVAGWPGWSGFADGQGSAGRFNYTGSVRLDAAGTIYVADASNHTVRKITPSGFVSTLAGSPGVSGTADGPGPAARFNGPAGVALDASGNVYVADSQNYTIRKITPDGTVSTLAGRAGTQGRGDGTGSGATFYDPENLAIDQAGNLYIADGAGNIVRKVTPAGVVTTIAGSGTAGSTNGVGTAARFNLLAGIAVDASGNIYVGDLNNNMVRKITPDGTVTTLAGSTRSGSADGTGTSARFYGPTGLAVDSSGNVYVADSYNNAVRKITSAGVVTTLAGSALVYENIDGPFSVARFNGPADVALDTTGNLFVADALNCTVRRMTQVTAGSAPTIQTQPASATVNAGANASFSAVAQGTAPLSYQWQQYNTATSTWTNLTDGSSFSGTITATLTVSSASVALDGAQFRCVVQNAVGSATSSTATLTVLGAPYIATQSSTPQIGVASGGSTTLSAGATGESLSYQWKFNGTAIAGATFATYTVTNFSSTSAGTYSVTVTNSYGSTTANIATLVASSTFLTNLSVRAPVGGSAGSLTMGFVLNGGGTAQMLVRGDGPSLANFGISGALSNPVLTLYNGSSTQIATNSGWNNDSALSAVFTSVGAFAFPAGSLDTALLSSLAPGNYTAQIAGANGSSGVALAELYDADKQLVTARLINISALSNVSTSTSGLAAGFVIAGTGSERLLVRAAGPTLTKFGISSPLANPVLTIYDSTGKAIASNTGWAGSSDLATVAAQVGAFAFNAGSADSAIVITLQPGQYTAQVSSATGLSGPALIEVYEVR